MRGLLLALSLLAAMPARAAPEPVRFGAVVIDDGKACLYTAEAPPAGTPILLIDPQPPQASFRAKVAGAGKCPPQSGQGGPSPEGVALAWQPEGRFAPMIAVLGTVGPVSVRAGQLTVRAGLPEQPYRVRSCASTDGLHLTAWQGAPLRSPRAWHAYVYLNQDLEADCKPSETR